MHEKCKYGGKIYYLLHKKLKACMVEKNPKNLSEYAHLLGSSKYILLTLVSIY